MKKLFMLSLLIASLSFCRNRSYEEINKTRAVGDEKRGFISTFGSEISEGREDHLCILYQYGISDFDVTTVIENGGSVSNANDMACLSSGTVSDGVAQLTSKRHIRYRPGHEAYAIFTARFSNGVVNSNQWIGVLDDVDGFAVGFDGNSFAILHRRNSVDTTVTQSNFNGDKLDGSGQSKFNLDPNNLNVFRIAYGWLGASPIRFDVLNEDGDWVTFHRIKRPNSATVPSVTNPVLPMRAEVRNNESTTNLELCTGSWNGGIIGVRNATCSRFFSEEQEVNLNLILGTETHLITIRNKQTFQGEPNNIEVRLTALGGGVPSIATFGGVLRVRKGASVSGLNFVDVDTDDSVVEVSKEGTLDASPGGKQIFRMIHSANGAGHDLLFLPEDNFQLILAPGESVTLTIESLISMSFANEVVGVLAWEERFA